MASRLFIYPVPPSAVGFYCSINASPLAPRVFVCQKYEREPGAD